MWHVVIDNQKNNFNYEFKLTLVTICYLKFVMKVLRKYYAHNILLFFIVLLLLTLTCN